VLCRRERDEPAGDWVYRDETWSVGIFDGYDIPGWLAGQTRRHTVGLGGLDDTEQASLGPLLASLSRAIASETGAEKVYVAAFGEVFAHFHFMLMARPAGVALEHRGPNLILAKDRYRDPAAAVSAAEGVRRALVDQFEEV
jgi:diadenosine tetraphosphate (Ap4A) HIT family hydrolase